MRRFAFLGGIPDVIVPDNLRAGIARACRYGPDVNRAYGDLAAHYGIAVLPARARKPRDKAKVETAVPIVERERLAPLRHCTFFSLGDLNAALRERLAELNHRPLRGGTESRAQRFERIDRPALRPLPPSPYAFAEWRQAKVHRDDHVQVEQSLYSVPYGLVGCTVDVRLAAATVEVFHQAKLVAAHARAHETHRISTQPDHRAPAHATLITRSIDQLSQRAAAIGPATAAMLTAQFERKQHPEEAHRRCLGVLRLAQDFDPVRLEQACARALELKLFAYRAIRDLILHPHASDVAAPSQAHHEYLRGPAYYQ